MPAAAPDSPRKMLPPPTTRQTCAPKSTACFRSAAMASTVVVSMPYDCVPISASPEILTRTLLYLGTTAIVIPCCPSYTLRRSGCRPHFSRKIRGWLIDAFADRKAAEPGNAHGRANIFRGIFQYLCHWRFAVHHKHLRQQHVLLVELAHSALDHFPDDVLGFSGLTGLIFVD